MPACLHRPSVHAMIGVHFSYFGMMHCSRRRARIKPEARIRSSNTIDRCCRQRVAFKAEEIEIWD